MSSDNEGLIPEVLETTMQQHLQLESTTKTPFNAMVYLMTTFSNPKGFSCSPGRCLFDMVKLAISFFSNPIKIYLLPGTSMFLFDMVEVIAAFSNHIRIYLFTDYKICICSSST